MTPVQYQAEELAQSIRRDCLEISGVPPSESYSSNDIVRSVGKLIGIQVTDGNITTAHAVPSFKTERLLSGLSEEMSATGFMQIAESLRRRKPAIYRT